MNFVKSDDNIVRVNFGKRAEAQNIPTPVEPVIEIDPLTQQKYDLFCALIKEGIVMITLDARYEQVRVPPQFAQQRDLRLNFAHEFNAADFSYDPKGVRSFLSFDEGYFFCDIPWAAVYGFYAHKHEKGFAFDMVKTEEKAPKLTLVKE